ncbi:MAG: riboflavin biosynthesis protein RibD, partial [Micrococcus sp.]|nr:riboflavin biosynthesis protein RibD [Micrococcus sp.]
MDPDHRSGDRDQARLLAVQASAESLGWSSPNPPVGAVALDAAGQIVAVGATEPPGGRHAEIVALDTAGPAAAGGTLVVTLEPCDHTGRT